jgi:hypothetical protein
MMSLINSTLVLLRAVLLVTIIIPAATRAESPAHDLAVAYLSSSTGLEAIPHPYPMFYHHHVAPHGVQHGDKLFLAYQDDRGRPVAMSYDAGVDVWQGPVRAADFGLGRDTHGNPSICVDRGGFVHLFYGAHGGLLRQAVSAEPLNISQWRDATNAAPRATYPQSQLLANGEMALLYRSGGHTDPWVLALSRDGQSWSEPQNVIDLRRDPPDPKAAAYCVAFPGVGGKTLHMFFIHKDDNAGRVDPHPWRPLKYPGLTEAVYRYNLYYVRRDSEGHWTNAAGEPVQTPISKRVADDRLLVYDSGDEMTYLAAIALDDNDHPYARFKAGVVDWGRGDRVVVPWRTYYATPDDAPAGQWQLTENITDVPAPVRPWLDPAVVPVYDTDGGLSREWFLRHEVGAFADGRGSHLFLGHSERGWIEHAGGPAQPPQ